MRVVLDARWLPAVSRRHGPFSQLLSGHVKRIRLRAGAIGGEYEGIIAKFQSQRRGPEQDRTDDERFGGGHAVRRG